MTLTAEQISVFNSVKDMQGFDSVDFLRQCQRYDNPAHLYTRVKNNARKFYLREVSRAKGITCREARDRAYNVSRCEEFGQREYAETRYLSPEEYALICAEYGSIEHALFRIDTPRKYKAWRPPKETVTLTEFAGAISALLSEREIKAIGELLK